MLAKQMTDEKHRSADERQFPTNGSKNGSFQY